MRTLDNCRANIFADLVRRLFANKSTRMIGTQIDAAENGNSAVCIVEMDDGDLLCRGFDFERPVCPNCFDGGPLVDELLCRTSHITLHVPPLPALA